MGCEPALVVFREVLAAEQQDGMFVPGILDLLDRFAIERAAEIDTANFSPDDRVQLGDRNSPGSFGDNGHVSLPSILRLL
jgi:hypothetical protein